MPQGFVNVFVFFLKTIELCFTILFSFFLKTIGNFTASYCH